MAFNDVETSTSLGFKYLYHPPHTFTSFVLSPCQTMIFPPGQVYAYATVSLEGDTVSLGAILNGLFFLAAGCMKCSWFSSWLDRSSSNQSTSDGTMVATCLMAMVWQAVLALTSTPLKQVLHSPDILNLCVLALMTMMFIGAHEHNTLQMAQALCCHCKEQELNTFDVLLEEFSDLKIVNCAWNPEEMDAQEHEECHTKSISFRKNMLEAIEHIVPEPGDE
ncbi:uncharacterized protein EI90DRAFT_3135283 [Cantharellus anzutake]|uniref:uncharacterized protein n=1 Tax=Cantharellus anzutake TaxID=1750568 RepID=UPI001903C5AC|nr:uncharacterized protein EI90DRAFT_3135283 [Cantharellus anzutake]KAF8315302.1 hypothetical protein EI90DRAFT_3135283 [Cantharellus anzutake]